MLNIEQMIMKLEESTIDSEILKAQRKGADALKKINKNA